MHDRMCPEYMQYADPCPFCRVIAKVRADERAKTEMEEIGDVIRADRRRQREDLRAQVEALFFVDLLSGTYVMRADVLALFDGSGDD